MYSVNLKRLFQVSHESLMNKHSKQRYHALNPESFLATDILFFC